METLKCAVIAYICVILLGMTWLAAGHADEWKVEVVDFDFQTANIILQDEDGFQWTCPFGENDWAIGEEYILVLNGSEEPQILEF